MKKIKTFLFILLVAVVIIEGYLIFLLQDKIEKSNDELKNISVQLQLLKAEREELKAGLSSVRKTTEDNLDGTTPER